MGRHADALEHAQKRRFGASPRRVEAIANAMHRWSNWYGVARSDEPDTPPDHDTIRAQGQPVTGMSPEIVAYYEPSSLRSEQYRSLRTRLISANTQREHRIIAVTSAVPREGKTVTAANLAFSIAEISHLKVLLVDGDLRQGRLAQLLNDKKSRGLADLLDGIDRFEDLVRTTPLPNLFHLQSGRTRDRSATELLSRKSARAAFHRIQREYDYTIVDTPPATTVADVGIIGQMIFGAIFVIRMHRTAEPIARHAIKLMLSNNVNVLGGLLIGENDPSSGYGKKYNYYRYYKE